MQTEKNLAGYNNGSLPEFSFNHSYRRYREETINRYRHFSKKTAITYIRDSGEVTTTTFTQMLQGHEDISVLMLNAGVVSGDRVAIIAPHSPQSVLAALGLAYANITTVLIDATLPIGEINRLLAYSDVQACFTTARIYGEITTIMKKAIPFFELCSKENEYRLFEDCVRSSQKNQTSDPEKDVIAILFSSGTTAQMKGVKVTYDSVMKASEIFIRNVKWRPEYSYLHVFPLNHIAGYATVQAFLACGSELGMIENMTATKLQQALLTYQPHGFGMIPKVFEMLEDKIRLSLKQKGFLAEKSILCLMALSSFLRKYFGCRIGRKWLNFVTKQVFGENIVTIGTGASLCRPSTSKFFLDLGLYWTNNYASTETNVPAASTGNFDKYPVGMAGYTKRNPEIEIKINMPDKNGIGEIYIKSQLMMKGYFREDELTRKSYDGEYFKTGDYGYIDKRGNLYVTGRVKESILLSSGKKVSPADVENFYKTACEDISFAVCGCHKKDSTYDDIYLFVQTKGKKDEDIECVIRQVYLLSNTTANLYRLSNVHRIEVIPLTSVGKVKRFELQRYINGENFYDAVDNQQCKEYLQTVPVETGVIELIKQRLPLDSKISLHTDIQNELGLDSLAVLELDINIQELYGVSVVSEWISFNSVADLVNYINTAVHIAKTPEKTESNSLHKTAEDIQILKNVFSEIEEICDFEYIGIENIPDIPCVFVPNHSSHLDTIAIYRAISTKGEDRLKTMCCFAAKELANDLRWNAVLKAIGAIFVDRKVNSVAALNTLQKCITESQYSALIYPEGTRTRDGNIGEFLDGAAIVSLKTGAPLIPIGIKGAYEIWPPHQEKPKRLYEKQKITVKFGKPIYPIGFSVKQLTAEIKKEVEKLCGVNYENRD